MVQARAESSSNERRATLHIGASFSDGWDNIVLPWFESISRFPLTAGPSAVVLAMIPQVDPAEDLIVIFMTQLMPSSSYPLRRELRVLTYAALVD